MELHMTDNIYMKNHNSTHYLNSHSPIIFQWQHTTWAH